MTTAMDERRATQQEAQVARRFRVPPEFRERWGAWFGRLLCKVGLHDWKIVRWYITCYDMECTRCPAKDFDSILCI